MNGDFSRNTFDPRHRFSRVLMQQGRVLLDADWNEQGSIVLHSLRTLATHLIGPHGTPDDGFRIESLPGVTNDFVIRRGHYYVDGILCENTTIPYCPPRGEEVLEDLVRYSAQPDYPRTEDECRRDLEPGRSYLVYLDVWERHLTHLEAEHIREVALGGPDTATRARIVWQVRVRAIPSERTGDRCDTLLDVLLRRPYPRPCLRARARVPEVSEDPCIIPPEARYRGAENQLYRVEIHRGGTADDPDRPATWKWSRDNGAVVFGLRSLQGSTARLETLGPDERHSLREGDWVEIVDDRSVLTGRPYPLVQVSGVDQVRSEVTLEVPQDTLSFDETSTTHPLLRRWDHGSDAIPVQEGKWIDLEDGVQVQFVTDRVYRPGDHWLIPARTATGDVLWPVQRPGTPRALQPDGIEHHYAPLARVLVSTDRVRIDTDCRRRFEAIAEPIPEDAAEEEERDGEEEETDIGREARELRELERERERQEEARVRELEGQVEPRIAGLVRITHVGRRRAERLLESGRDSAAAIATMTPGELRELLAINDSTAEEMLTSARSIAREGT